MTPRSRWGLVGVWVAVLLALAARGETELAGIQTVGKGVELRLVSLLDKVPRSGTVPIRATIANRTSKAGTWDLIAESQINFNKSIRVRFEESMEVGPGEVKSFEMYVPVAVGGSGAYQGPNLEVRVLGPGIRSNSTATMPPQWGHSVSKIPYCGMSVTIGAKMWSALEVAATGNSEQLQGSLLTLDYFPEDWRGLAGLSQLWLATSDWERLSPAARLAARDWVFQGGALVVVGNRVPSGMVADLGGKEGGEQAWTAGAGSVVHISQAATSLSENDVLRRMKKGGFDMEKMLVDSFNKNNWAAAKNLEDPMPNVWLIFAFMTIFAVIVGPVNLFVFAKGNNRSRLFVTTPLISIVASALLGLLIVIQDGFGGDGVRQLAVYLAPTANRAQVFQQQLSRTGLVFGADFQPEETVYAFPLGVGGSSNDVGSRTMNLNYQDGHRHDGDWFRSRSRQAHYFQAVRQTRGRLELVGETSDGLPEIQSNLEVAVRELYLTNAAGQQFYLSELGAGERKVALRTSSFKQARYDVLAKKGPRLQALVAGVTAAPATFFCEAVQGGADLTAPIESYGGIRWDDEVIVFGHLIATEAE